jgi:hypothetical protein
MPLGFSLPCKDLEARWQLRQSSGFHETLHKWSAYPTRRGIAESDYS